MLVNWEAATASSLYEPKPPCRCRASRLVLVFEQSGQRLGVQTDCRFVYSLRLADSCGKGSRVFRANARFVMWRSKAASSGQGPVSSSNRSPAGRLPKRVALRRVAVPDTRDKGGRFHQQVCVQHRPRWVAGRHQAVLAGASMEGHQACTGHPVPPLCPPRTKRHATRGA